MAGHCRKTGVGELALPNLRLIAPTLEKNEERNGRPSKSDALRALCIAAAVFAVRRI
jgi:hypothetical protein